MLWHLWRDSRSTELPARIPEPELVMSDDAQAQAFAEAGLGEGPIAYLNFYHALQASAVMRPGEQVLDLACGPGNVLAWMARMNPDVQFVGLDASAAMLARAEALARREGLGNLRFVQGDITALSGFADRSVQVLTSTMSLHHLPDVDSLQRCWREAGRVLVQGGGLYVVDFGRLKREATRRFFLHDRAGHADSLFARDFYNSMLAAFSVAELRAAAASLGQPLEVHESLLAPFMVTIKSANRRQPESGFLARTREAFAHLPHLQRRDFFDFVRLFTRAGYPLYCPVR